MRGVRTSLEPAALQKLLRDYPYERFPVWTDGTLQGVLTRAEARAALAEKRPPQLVPAVVCAPESKVREVQRLLLESPTGLVVVRGAGDGGVVGVVTLHDMLRAQVALGQRSTLSANATCALCAGAGEGRFRVSSRRHDL